MCAYRTLCVSTLVKCLLKDLFIFQTGFSVLLNVKILFYFTVTSPLLDMYITDPFPQHVECLFIILMGAFENSSFLSLVNSSLSFFFPFYSSCFLCPSRKSLPISKLQKFFKLKFLEVFLVSVLTFRYYDTFQVTIGIWCAV